jgi:cytidyltransferase-like protein
MKVVYLGSFDPPHISHKEAVTLTLENIPEIENIYILTNAPSKKTRAPLHHRLEMLKLCFDGVPKVTIIEEEFDTFLPKLSNPIGLIGSDRTLQIEENGEKLRYKVSGWIISQRKDTPHHILRLVDIPVIQHVTQLTNISSTICRLIHFFGGTTEYTNSEYINKHGLYKPSSNWFQGELIEKVIAGRNKLILVSRSFYLKRASLRKDEYVRRNLLKCVRCIEYLKVYYDNTHVYLLMPNLTTLGYETVSNFLESNVSENLKIQSIQMVAQDLKRLHSLKNRPVHGDVNPNNIMIKGSEIVWIDFELSKEDTPAAREYYQFISSLYYNKLKEAAKWRSVFEETYQPNFPKEEDETFKKKWLSWIT